MERLKNQVESCLRDSEETRNSDIALTVAVWLRFYGDKVVANKDGVRFIRLEDLWNLPREDNVKRIRAIFQNDKKMYLPTNAEVAKKRGWKEEDWCSFLGYNPELKEIKG